MYGSHTKDYGDQESELPEYKPPQASYRGARRGATNQAMKARTGGGRFQYFETNQDED